MHLEYKAKSECYSDTSLSVDKLFCNLSAETLRTLAEIKKTKQFTQSETIFSSGEMPSCVYVLVDGQIKLTSFDEKKKERMTRLVEPHEMIGVTESMTNLPYKMNAQAATKCRVDCINNKDFIQFLEQQPEVCFRLLKTLGINLQENYKLFCSSNF
jgi:CRP/FNR family transcriptional regulator